MKTLTSYIQSEHTDTGVMLTSAVTASSGDDSHATASEVSKSNGIQHNLFPISSYFKACEGLKQT